MTPRAWALAIVGLFWIAILASGCAVFDEAYERKRCEHYGYSSLRCQYYAPGSLAERRQREGSL